jgi:hypothetical protein
LDLFVVTQQQIMRVMKRCFVKIAMVVYAAAAVVRLPLPPTSTQQNIVVDTEKELLIGLHSGGDTKGLMVVGGSACRHPHERRRHCRDDDDDDEQRVYPNDSGDDDGDGGEYQCFCVDNSRSFDGDVLKQLQHRHHDDDCSSGGVGVRRLPPLAMCRRWLSTHVRHWRIV